MTKEIMTPKIKSLIEFNSRLDAILFAEEAPVSPTPSPTNSNKPKYDGSAVSSAIQSLRSNHDAFAQQAKKDKGDAGIWDIVDHFQKTQKKVRSLLAEKA
jgi:hypothetical protein